MLAACATFGAAQAQGNGKISGTVTDESNDSPVEFATVAVNDPSTGKPIDGTVCDDKGKFSINKIPNGAYNVVISFIGFETQTIPVTLGDKDDNIDMGTIKISPKTEVLKEVTVEGQKSLIEEKVDRTIYNAENDQTTRGGDATDVLRRVPMVSVDLDGNLSMRGNSNVRVLINNRPSTITAGSIADALKMIPAEDIKSVEVITSPSAKYDAEGSAGIINIITKKNVLQGATLGINSSVGLRGSNLGLNGALRKGKLGLSLGGWGRGGYNTFGSFENVQVTNGITNTQNADTHDNGLFGHYTFGLDYDFDKNNFINSSVRYGVRDRHGYQDNLLTQTYIGGALDSTSLRNSNSVGSSLGLDVNVGYTHLYPRETKELSTSLLYSRDDDKDNFINSNFDPTETFISTRLKNLNKSANEEMAFQVDYQTPITDDELIETGLKGIRRNVASNYQYYFDDGSGTFVESSNADLSNTFNYQQNISAGYLSFTQNFLKTYTIKAGARYEYTTIDAHFQDQEPVTIPSYGVLVPSVNFSKKLSQGNIIKAAYNRRIQRPSIRYLNPNLQASNPLNTSIGNPNLGPEYTNNWELDYSYYIKNTAINLSTFYRNTNNSIQQLRDVSGDTIRTTYQNIGHEDAYGLSLFVNVNVGSKLSLNGGTDIYYSVLDNKNTNPLYAASNEGWVAGYRMFGSYNIGHDWGFQFFGFYHGRDIQLQGYHTGFGIYSLSLNKNFMNKKASIGFGAENFLTNGFKFKNVLNTEQIQQTSTNVMHNMNFKINFSLRLGQLGKDVNASRRHTSSITNDDLKQGGDDMQSGMEQMQPQGNQNRGGLFRRGQGKGQAPGQGQYQNKQNGVDSTQRSSDSTQRQQPQYRQGQQPSSGSGQSQYRQYQQGKQAPADDSTKQAPDQKATRKKKQK